MTALDPMDVIWREYKARLTFGVDPDVSARELVRNPLPHTAVDLVTDDETLPGWMYYSAQAILFIGDRPPIPVLERPATNDDRLLYLPYWQLGPATVEKGPSRKERMLTFVGSRFVMPKTYAEAIAKYANAR
jgi:hypothetical protein